MSVQAPRFDKPDSKPSKVAARVEETVGDGFDVKKFVEHFEVLSEAPEGLARLREFALDLAMKGLLCPQRRSDEPARDLLSHIRQRQQQAERSGEIERVPAAPPIDPHEVPHDLPEGWAWTRLSGGVLEIQIGPFGSLLHQSDYVSDGTPLVNPAHIKDGRIVPETKKGVAPGTLARLGGYRGCRHGPARRDG